MHVEHIDPNGGNSLDNLCLSCANCNLSKSTATSAIDPLTNHVVNLFNPRLQLWREHFEWTEDKTRIIGLTDIARGTVFASK